jgi:hypothetical protein
MKVPMNFRTAGLAVLVLGCAALAAAQTPLRLQINGGLVTLHAQNVPVGTILSEWSRVGGAKIIGGDRIVGAALTLELEGVPERQALDIVLRGVSGYMLAARDAGGTGASMYDRIMILPTSAAPRNPPPAAAMPVFQGAPGGIVRPVIPRQDDRAENEDDIAPINPVIDGVPLGRPGAFPRPVGMPVAAPVFVPPVTINPDDDQPQLPLQPPAGVAPTPANPFGLPAGSSGRPGVITPVPQAPPGAPRTQPEN